MAIGTPRIVDASLASPGDAFSVRFTSPTAYEVDLVDAQGNVVQAAVSAGSYDPAGGNVLSLSRGMELYVQGAPAAGDSISVQATPAGASTDLNIFHTLDSIIAGLAQPLAGDDAMARFQNLLGSALQRIDVNYNNVLTVRSSVGARLNELDALDANGSQRALGYSQQLSRMEDLDYYGASTQLQLRTSALEAAALAFRKIQATSLFNMNSG